MTYRPRAARRFGTRALVALTISTLAIGILAAVFLAGTATAATCADSLQAKINSAPSGGTVKAKSCIYREQITINKRITLEGQPGSEIRGSEIWSRFNRVGDTFVSANSLPGFSANGQCESSAADCRRPEQVFINGSPLKQLAAGSRPAAGQFSLDSKRRVVLGENPAGKQVEVSVRRFWISGRAPNVTIKGFRMKHAANDSQWRAALSNEGHSNWTLQGSVLSDSHGALVSFREATGLKIFNSELYRGGQLAVHSSGAALTLSGNKIHHNNVSGFDPTWEAGGVKAVRMGRLLAEKNQVWSNEGRGLWCDLGCQDTVLRSNRLHHNSHSGIFFEVSTLAKIHDNVLWENGWGKSGSSVGSLEPAIHIRNSRNAEVYRNTVAWNRGGISVIRSDRKDNRGEDVHGNFVHDNRIFSKDYPSSATYHAPSRTHALAWIDTFRSKTLYGASKNNRGRSNDYFFLSVEGISPPRFRWQDSTASLGAFNKTNGEESGRYLAPAEKSSIVKATGIPSGPER